MTALADYRSFIDLATFDAPSSGTPPFGSDCRFAALRDAPVESGRIHLSAGESGRALAQGDLFLVTLSGDVALGRDEATVHLGAGESCVIPAGTAFDWSAPGAAVVVFMRYPGGTAIAPGIVPIDTQAELTPSGAPLAELLVGETPSCRNNTMFRSADGEFTCGVWDSTPYHRRAMRYGHFELMVLLHGSVTFVDEGAREQTFRAGDVFLVEQGASCSWESREDVAKIYAIYRPLA